MNKSLPDLPQTCAGGCHCGAVRFEVTIRVLEVLDCNCSICIKKGYLHLIVPRSDFRLLQGEENLETYTFGTHTARHHFCKTCGVQGFYMPRSHPDCWDINLRCLDDNWLPQMNRIPFNGRDWEQNISQII
jgi:hypothetical protein